jgi:hypothetical protein
MRWRVALLCLLMVAACTTAVPVPTLAPTRAALRPTDTPVIPGTPSAAVPQLTATPPPGSATAPEAASPTPLPAEATFTPLPPGASAPPVIHSFTISPTVINPGEAVTLQWRVSAGQVVIYRLDATLRLTMPAHEVPLTGTLTLTTPATLRNQAHFVLFAIAPGSSVQAGVSADIRCPDTWFFANPPGECPASPPSRSRMVKEDFERGHMIWMETSGLIYILYEDGASWEIRPNAWQEGMAWYDPALVPPAGLYQPVRGFGLAWRDEEYLEGARVRDRIGWAVNAEHEWGEGAAQCNSAPKYNTCFIGAGGEVYMLKPERSGWFLWAGPTPVP